MKLENLLKFFCGSIFTFFIYEANAQSAYLGINLNNFYRIKEIENKSEVLHSEYIDYQALPTLSSAHHLKGNFGVVLEMGHSIHKAEFISEYEDDNIIEKRFVKHKKNLYQIAVTAFNEYYWKNYYCQLGINLSWNHEYKYDAFVRNNYIDKQFNNESITNGSRIYPNSFTIGFYFQPAIYRKIFKQLYGGVKLQSGVDFFYRNGKYNETINYISNNQIINTVTNFNEMGINANFIRLQVSIIYMLSNKK